MSGLENPTPNDANPDEFDLEATSLAGTDSAAPDSNAPDDGAPVQDDYETVARQRAESAREAKRLKERERELEQRLQQTEQRLYYMQGQMSNPQPAAPPEEEKSVHSYLTKDEAKQLSDAVINDDTDTVAKLQNAGFQRMKKEMYTELSSASAQQNELMNSINYIRSHEAASDPASPIWQKTMEVYTRMVSNPATMAGIKNETIPINGQQVNPHALKLSLMTAEASQIGGSKQDEAIARELTRNSPESFIEPSEGNTTPDGKTPMKFSERVHLSAEERQHIKNIQRRSDASYTAKDYWEGLEMAHPGMQDARLKAKRPLTPRQFARR